MARFNHGRFQIARERSGILKKELAATCGVAPQTISNWESGFTEPTEQVVTKIGAVTGFSDRFFSKGEIEPLSEGGVSFRSRSRIPARSKHAALAAGALARELSLWIEERFELPQVDLPSFDGQSPELVSEVIRAEWMLGNKPIPNMIQLLESRGAIVFSLADDVKELDAFSFWSEGRPIVLLNTMKSCERSRIDSAHELFHLMCHKEETGKKEEEDATGFAGALLLPKDDLYKNFRAVRSMDELMQAKHRWRVSLSALVVRLHELGIIKDWQYRTFFMELSKRGYRTREPKPLTLREDSAILSKVFSSLRKRGIKPRQVAQDLGWDRRHLDGLIFGLGATFLPLHGDRQSGTTKRVASPLYLVDEKD